MLLSVIAVLTLALSASASTEPFTCKRWTFKNNVYYLSDLDRVFHTHSSGMEARVSLCKPLPLDQLSPSSSPGCPVGSYACIWKSSAEPIMIAAFGPPSYASTNGRGDIVLYSFDALPSQDNNTFPFIARMALIYKQSDSDPYLYGPDLNGGCLDFSLYSDKFKSSWNSGTSGWGFFSWFFFLVTLCLVCYFIFGYIYKSSIMGLSGIEAIPNADFWITVWEQVSDSIRGTWRSTTTADPDGRGTYEQI